MSKERKQAEIDLMLELTNELRKESDRAAALLAGAYLDHLLGRLIVSAMVVKPSEVEELLLEGANAPMSAFSSRIDIAYCLGLLSKDEQRDLNLIRKIRNDFAHKLSGLSFETEHIANRCRELNSAKVDGQPATARECYQKGTIRLMVDILLKIQDIDPQSDTT